MKKILMFSFLLATSTISYSSLQNSTVEGTLNTTATIITPLTIQADKDLDFGNVLPSAVNHAFSSFTIKKIFYLFFLISSTTSNKNFLHWSFLIV